MLIATLLLMFLFTSFAFLTGLQGIYVPCLALGLLILIFGALLLKKKSFLKSFTKALWVLVLSAICSLVLLFAIAILELNILTLALNVDPKIVNLNTDRNEIVGMLKANYRPPKMVTTEPQKAVSSIAVVMSGDDNLYGKYVLGSIPTSIILPIKTSSSLILIDNTLIITEISTLDLQEISPILGYLLVKDYFAHRQIKRDPKVSIMNKNDYSVYREKKLGEKLLTTDLEMQRVDDARTRISVEIRRDNDMISRNQEMANKALLLKESKYKNCCSATHKRLDREISQANKNINDWKQVLRKDSEILGQYTTHGSILKLQKNLVQMREKNISNELGIFEAEDSIKIALLQFADGLDEESDEDILLRYFGALTHEYLHYASFISKEKKIKNEFFEEGLTEYFTRKLLGKNSLTSTSIAYPLHVKIIREIAKNISDKELEYIYFNKDDERLEKLLDHAYGKDFYKNNQILFQSLQYASDPDQQLRLANEVMRIIRGDQLKKEDLAGAY